MWKKPTFIHLSIMKNIGKWNNGQPARLTTTRTHVHSIEFKEIMKNVKEFTEIIIKHTINSIFASRMDLPEWSPQICTATSYFGWGRSRTASLCEESPSHFLPLRCHCPPAQQWCAGGWVWSVHVSIATHTTIISIHDMYIHIFCLRDVVKI